MFEVETWSSKHSDQFARASAVVTDWDNIAQVALFVLSDCFEHIDKIVGSASTGEDDNAFGLAVGHGVEWRCRGVAWQAPPDSDVSAEWTWQSRRPQSMLYQVIMKGDTVAH